MNLTELRKKLDNKEISSRELTEEYLNRIKKYDSKIESFITVCDDVALKEADEAQKIIDKGIATPLTGIPLAIKDNICTENVLTTAASKMLGNFVSPYNATVMEKLNSENAVMLGKTSLDEFAMGGSTQTSAFKKTKNPYDLDKVPGGSSGGSAAAVSANLAPAALGSDTGGSIRQPSSFCGVTGLKPTYSRVSRYGLIAFASSFDQIGPIAQNAEDCGIILNAIQGYDPHDGTASKKICVDNTSKIGQSIKGMKIAIPKEFYAEGIDDEIKTSVMNAAKEYEKQGAELIECSMPSLKYAIACYYLMSSAEAATNLARFDGIKYGHRSEKGENFNDLISNSRREGFGWEVKRRILLGNYALSSGYYDAYYAKARALRLKIREEYADIFSKADVILTPTAPTAAYGVNDNVTDPKKMYLGDICTVTVNIAGLPAVSTPCGYTKDGMPIGMSIVGKAFDEATILQVADNFEKNFAKTEPKAYL